MKLSENGKKKLKSILRAVMFAALYVVVLPILGLLLGVAICKGELLAFLQNCVCWFDFASEAVM